MGAPKQPLRATLKVEVFLEGEKNGSTSLQNSLFGTILKVEVKGEKTAQLRSKTAFKHNSVLVVTTRTARSLRGHYVTTVTTRSLRGHYAVILRSLHYGHYAVTTVTTRLLRSLRGHYGYYAVTTRSLRSLRSLRSHYGHYAVTTDYAVTTVTVRSLRSPRGHYGHYAVTTRSLCGHYAVTARSLRSCGHYAVKKSTRSSSFFWQNGSTSLQNAVSAGCIQTDIALASDFFSC